MPSDPGRIPSCQRTAGFCQGTSHNPQVDKFHPSTKNFRSLPREETSRKHQLQVTAGLIEEHVPRGVFNTEETDL